MEINCDNCGEAILSPEWETVIDRDIEHTYFTCPSCGHAYHISVTDGKLREDIARYKRMAAQIVKKKQPETFQRRVQKLKEENMKRSRELKEAYPLTPFLIQE